MASSDHLNPSLIDPWILRPASFLDPWFAEAFSRDHDTDTLTRGLQVSLSPPSPDSKSNTTNTSSSDTSLAPDVVSSFLIPTPGLNTAYSGYGSFEIENVLLGEETVRCAEAQAQAQAPMPKQRQRNSVVASGKVAKRKSRATKRSQTTFITVDTASFRQMVQQVTGSRLGHNPAMKTGQIMRPQPHRPGSDLYSNNGSSSSSLGASAIIVECLPTLDTSALLLDRHRAQDQQHAAEMLGQGSVDPVAALTDDFEPFGSFPTLDSWNSM